jgi:hypothetical protein
VVGILVRLRTIPLDKEVIVRVGLDVKVALARKADHLHRKAVLDAVVEKHLAALLPDLRALIANDRGLQPKALDPWQGTWKRSARGGDDSDPRAHQAADRLDVARIQLQRGAQDGPVEVEG